MVALVDQYKGFPGGSVVKHPLVNARDTGSIPEAGRSPGGRNSNPLQYSCQENLMVRILVGPSSQGGKGIGRKELGMREAEESRG